MAGKRNPSNQDRISMLEAAGAAIRGLGSSAARTRQKAAARRKVKARKSVGKGALARRRKEAIESQVSKATGNNKRKR